MNGCEYKEHLAWFDLAIRKNLVQEITKNNQKNILAMIYPFPYQTKEFEVSIEMLMYLAWIRRVFLHIRI